MFESLTDKLSNAMRHLRGTAKLSEDNMSEALKEVRFAFNGCPFQSSSTFINPKRSASAKRFSSPTPGQQIAKIINDRRGRNEGETEL